MDSLTQVVLGAACGEAVLGRKIGNRAIVWGGIGGTIPDLDVLVGQIFMNEMNALAFHRGFMHSLLFGVMAPVVIGFLVFLLYDSSFYRRPAYRWFVAAMQTIGVLIIVTLISAVIRLVSGHWNVVGIILCLGGAAFVVRRLLLKTFDEQEEVNATFWDWYWLFFASIITHPLLDIFTNYGTQLFQPFSDYRVAFNTVSIVDPLYTVPFGLCVIGASMLHRENNLRHKVNTAGLVWSCSFLGLTVINKQNMANVFETSLAKSNLKYSRYTSNPTLFNNLLWYAVAESDSNYYYGMYSLLDKQRQVLRFDTIPKNRSLISGHQFDNDVNTLRWFSDNYYALSPTSSRDTLHYFDLRFGIIGDHYRGKESFVFPFELTLKNNRYTAHQHQGPSPQDMDVSEVFGALINRVKGR